MEQKDINIGDKFGIYEVLGELQRTKTTQPRRFLVKCEVCGAENLSINKDNLLRCPTHCQPRNHHYLKEEEIILYSPDFEIERKQRDFNRRKQLSKLAEIPKETWQELINVSTSYSDLLGRIGKRDGRQDYKALKTFLRQFPDLDFSQMKENARKKEHVNEIPFGEVFKKGTNYSSSLLRNKLIKAGIKTFKKCEKCGITEWNGEPIVIQLHHKDGDRTNNELDNIAELCPNCHSQTENYSRRKNRTTIKNIEDFDYSSHLESPSNKAENTLSILLPFSKELSFENNKLPSKSVDLLPQEEFSLPVLKQKKKYFCFDCGKEITKGAVRCVECDRKRNQNLSKCPSKEELEKEIPKHPSLESMGRFYGVSGATIKKWIRKFNLNSPRPTRENLPKKEMCSYSQYTINGIKRTLSCWERKLGINDFSLIKYEQEFGHDETREHLKKLINQK